MQAMKETASNIKSGIEKTKAVAQEKMTRMTANNPSEKEMATEKKEERIKAAEGREVKRHSYSTSGAIGQPSGAHQMSALSGHGSGQPTGASVVQGVVPSHPIGKATGTHNTHVGATGGS